MLYHDLSYREAVHPDWILYKRDRVTPAYEFDNPNMPLDFANPALESWQIQTYALPPHTGLVLLTGPSFFLVPVPETETNGSGGSGGSGPREKSFL